MRIYKTHFLFYIIFQIVFGSDTIKFIEPDSIYISNKLNSLINKNHNLNREYFLKGYGNNFCLTEDGRWFDNLGFECNVPSGFEHIKKVWEVKNEARKIREDKKYNEYKNKMFKKGAR